MYCVCACVFVLPDSSQAGLSHIFRETHSNIYYLHAELSLVNYDSNNESLIFAPTLTHQICLNVWICMLDQFGRHQAQYYYCWKARNKLVQHCAHTVYHPNTILLAHGSEHNEFSGLTWLAPVQQSFQFPTISFHWICFKNVFMFEMSSILSNFFAIHGLQKYSLDSDLGWKKILQYSIFILHVLQLLAHKGYRHINNIHLGIPVKDVISILGALPCHSHGINFICKMLKTTKLP